MWVIGRFEGNRAKSVLEHAGAGVGYIILDSGGGRYNPFCLAAFRYVGLMPLPEYLEEVKDPMKIQKYEKMRRQREGRPERMMA